MSGWTLPMVVGAGVFSITAGYFAVIRIPQWRSMPVPAFRTDFDRWLAWADRVQPALVVTTLVAASGSAATSQGNTRALATLTAAGFATILSGSLAILLPLQRRIVADRVANIDRARVRWFRGHVARTAVAVVSFSAAMLAAL